MTTDLRHAASGQVERRTPGSPSRIDALDGVRTIAVYLVVAFHAGLTSFEGGFIGVDVFFVLSGFLITRLLLHEYETRGRVNLPRFYARRARRLLPAAWVAIIATSVMFVGVATPFEREAVVGDAQAALLYIANWNFIREGQDYFAESLESSPFLHLWSLSVEEQFYLVWPLLALGLFRLWRRSTSAATLVVTGATLAGALWAMRLASDDIVRAYYGTDTRAYQLLAGATLAFLFARVSRTQNGDVPVSGARDEPAPRPDEWRAGVAGLALVAIIAISVSFSLDPVERGLAATIATAALIAALAAPGADSSRHTSRVARFGPEGFLASRPMTTLGDLSYATYLWHWPIVIIVGRVFEIGPRTMFVIVALGSTGLAKLSMDLVERPVRRLGARSDRRRDLTTSGIAAAITVALALVLVPAILRADVDMLRAADRPGFSSTEASAAPPTAPVGNSDDIAAASGDTADQPAEMSNGPATTLSPAPAGSPEPVDTAIPADDSPVTEGELPPDATTPTGTTEAGTPADTPNETAPLTTLPLPFGPEPAEPLPVPADLGQPALDAEYGEKTGCVNEVPTSVDGCTSVEGTGTRLLLLGDSHATKLNAAFNEYGARNGFTVATVSGNGCPWQDGLLYRNALPVEGAKQFCRDQRDAVYDWYVEEFAPDVVVIANHDQTTENYDVVPRPERGTDEDLAGLDLIREMSALSFDRLGEAAERVILLEPLANSPFHPINCLSAAQLIDDCAFGLGAWPHVETPVLRDLASERPGVSTLDMTPFACPHFPLCRPIIDGIAVREDPDHFDVRHALRIVDPLMSRLGL